MLRFVAIMNRAGAGLTVAAMTGVAGMFLGLLADNVRHPAMDGFSLYELVYVVGFVCASSLLIGAPAGIAVMLLTRARHRPWFAVPRLLVGTTSGFLLVFSFMLVRDLQFYIPELVAAAAAATVGGLIATRLLPAE